MQFSGFSSRVEKYIALNLLVFIISAIFYLILSAYLSILYTLMISYTNKTIIFSHLSISILYLTFYDIHSLSFSSKSIIFI